MQTVVALFRDFNHAEQAVDHLVRQGYDRNQMSLVSSNASGEHDRHVRTNGDRGLVTQDAVTPSEGAAFGAASGGVIGALLGLGALAIPGIGPVIAAGPLIAALTGGVIGAVAGAPTGGLVAGLVRTHDVDEGDAELYAEGVRRGGTLLTVQVDDGQASDARIIINQYQPTDVRSESNTWRQSGWNKFDPNAEPVAAKDIEAYRSYTGAANGNAHPASRDAASGSANTSNDGTNGSTGISGTAGAAMSDREVIDRQQSFGATETETNRVSVYPQTPDKTKNR
jgi:hypothetical protein